MRWKNFGETTTEEGRKVKFSGKEDKHEHSVRFLVHNAATSDYDDNKIEEFFDQLQNVIDQAPKKDILVVQGDWDAKAGRDACGNWQGICGSFCNDDTNERGLRLLEFATFNDLVLANTFGHHKASRRWTWHSPNGKHHNQIDYILVRKRFRSGMNIARTRSFPEQTLEVITTC